MDGEGYIQGLVEALGVGGGERLGGFLWGIVSNRCVAISGGRV
jgi:hypothetical protein